MVENEVVDRNKESVLMPQVIKPHFKYTSSCPILLCTACELARAKKQNPEVIKQKTIEEIGGILVSDQ